MGTRRPAVRAIVFDLDNCLCAASELGADLFEPAFAAVRQANRGTLDEARLEQALVECWFTAFDDVAAHHGFSAQMTEAGRRCFASLEVTVPLQGYPDLYVVRDLDLPRFLVTSGFERLQASKIRALGIDSWFEAVVIDSLDRADRQGKRSIFERLRARGGWSADEVMVVGDNPASELAAGRSLGMVTVQTLRPGVTRWDEVDHHVGSLVELPPLLG